jgi:hypothetical protein
MGEGYSLGGGYTDFMAGTGLCRVWVQQQNGCLSTTRAAPRRRRQMVYLGEGDPVRPIYLIEIDSADLCRSYLWRYCVPLVGAIRT